MVLVQPGPWKRCSGSSLWKPTSWQFESISFEYLFYDLGFFLLWILSKSIISSLQMADPPLPWGCHIHPQGEIWNCQFHQAVNIPTSATKYSRASGLFLLPCHGIFVAGHHLLELPLAGHRTHLVAHLGSQLQAWGEERQPAGNALAPLGGSPKWVLGLRNLSKIGKKLEKIWQCCWGKRMNLWINTEKKKTFLGNWC